MAALDLVPYNAKTDIAEFGATFMQGLVAAAGMAEEAQRLADTAAQGMQYLSFEMTRAVFDFNDRFDDVDVYAVFGKAKDVERLNQRVLVHMGVLKREITKDDDIVYTWTSEGIRNLYEYTQELKDADPAEYTRRFNNRKRLNMKLSEAYKTACTLADQGLKPDDLYYSEDAETKAMVPTIRNAPKEIAGDRKEVQLGSRKAVAGATMSPTMSSLVKLATEKHKPEAAAASDKKDKGEDRAGVAKIGISDEDFGSIVNTLIRTITAQENEFSAEKLKHLNACRKAIEAAIDAAKPAKQPVKAAAE
jgi:hypothetical protein